MKRNEFYFLADEIGYDKVSLSKEFADYQIWLQKKKKLRKDLNSIGLNDKWLQSKGDLTELERRVLDKLSPKDSNQDDENNEIIVMFMITMFMNLYFVLHTMNNI